MKASIILSTLVLSQASITFGTYTVAILNNNGQLLCNGAIIHNEFIVTSASCVGGAKPSELIIRAGSENYNKGGVKAEVSKIIAHRKYNETSHDYDIAVLKLKGCLAISNSNIDEIPISEKRISAEECILTGWIYNSVSVHGPLQLKSVNVYRLSECERVDAVNITTRMLCTTGITKIEECIDFAAGSPLVVEGKLIGIKCVRFPCNQNHPDVFTNVAVLSKFIQKVIKRLS